MKEPMLTPENDRANVEPTPAEQPAPASVHAPSTAARAESIMVQALTFCAQKMMLSGPKDAADRLLAGDGTACTYCFYSVAKQVAQTLGALDQQVKAVYTLDYDATPEDLLFADQGSGLTESGEADRRARLIHLIVWTERKTAALRSLAEALDRALVQACTDVFGAHHLTHFLDVQVVDDADVRDRVGYGALVSSIHYPAITIWER